MAYKKSETNELETIDEGTHELSNGSRVLTRGAVIGIAAAVAVATGVVGFVGGLQFQKGSSSAVVNQEDRFGGQGTPGMRGGSFGEVTAISDDSITISVVQGGPNSSSSGSSTKTFTINSSTKITTDGSTGSVSDISTGDTVAITADSTDSSIAASIRIGMGGMRDQGKTQSSTTDSASSST